MNATLTTNVTNATVIRAANLIASPWKNGGGVTREVAAHPPGAAFDAFVWRVSIADVAQAGPFSRFEGVGRTLTLLAGAGIRLVETGGTSHELLEPLDVAHFAGETQIDATLIDGATRDFNVMVHRASSRADLTIWRDGSFDAEEADTLMLFCAYGPVDVALSDGDTHLLDMHDTLRIDAPCDLSCMLRGEGSAVLAVRLYTRPTGKRGARS